jgi:DNA-binding IclR family transcriptional regulator
MTTTKRRKTLGADSTNAGDKPTIKSLATALRVLSRFISAQGPLGVGEFEQQLKLNKSQVSKILKTFREFGFLEQDATTQKYSVGLNAFALGNTYVNLYPLARDALPVMRKLVDETGHSAVLSVMHGTNVIHLLAVEGRLFIDGRWRVGRYMPYHSTSAGKLLLAFGPPERVDMFLKTHGLPRITSNTITKERQFRAELQKVRKTGISVTRSETYAESASIGAPVLDATGHAIAVLGLICPEHLLTRQEERKLCPPLQRSARELSLKMGAENYPFGI